MSNFGSFTVEERLLGIQKAFLETHGRSLDDKTVVRVQGALDLLTSSLGLKPPLPFVDRGLEPHVQSLDIDHQQVHEHLIALITALGSGKEDEAIYACRHLEEQVEDYLGRIHRAHRRLTQQENMPVDVVFMSDVSRIGRQLDQIHRTDSVRDASESVRGIQSELKQILENARNASGAVAEMQLAERFNKLHEDEKETANKFRTSTITFLAVGLISSIAFYLFNQFGAEEFDALKVAYNAIIIGAIFGLSGYFARQAKHHRDLSDWANTISVQLLTFDAFMDTVDNTDVRNSARLAFASRVFGAGPQPDGSDSSVHGPTILEQVLPLLKGSK